MIYYSFSTGGFYDDALKCDYEASETWPDDAVQVSESNYQYLLDGQSNGKVIVGGKGGQPKLSDPVPPSKDLLVKIAENEKTRLLTETSMKIAILQDAIKFNMSTNDEVNKLVELGKYRVLLSRVDTSKAPDIEWPA